MRGFQRFDHAAITLSGIELAGAKQEGPVQNRQAQESDRNEVGTVECGARRLTTLRALKMEIPANLAPYPSLHHSPTD
jgi:hypothetical protein